MATTPTPTPEPQLHLLEPFGAVYAEAHRGRFYALRGTTNQVWTLVSRDNEFQPKTFNTLVACDAALYVWLATR